MSKLRRHIELKNSHLVQFKSPRDVLQVGRLSVQLGIGSLIVDWYKDAKPVPSGQLFYDSSLRTDDRFRYCTNSRENPQNSIYLNS